MIASEFSSTKQFLMNSRLASRNVDYMYTFPVSNLEPFSHFSFYFHRRLDTTLFIGDIDLRYSCINLKGFASEL